MSAGTLIQLQIVLLGFAAAGFVLSRMGAVPKAALKFVTDLLVNVVLPCSILHSFITQDMSAKTLSQSAGILIINICVQVFMLLCSRFFFPKSRGDAKKLMQYGMINSNATFIGLPVISEVYGPLGMLLGSTGVIPQRVTIWTAGARMFDSEAKTKSRTKQLLALLLHPCIITVIAGFLLMFLPVKWPYAVTKFLSSVGGCTSFMALFIVGVNVSDMKIRELLDLRLYWYCLLRLIAAPLLLFLILRLIGVDSVVTGVSVLMAAMPCGATTAIMANKYDVEPRFAAALILSSTVLSTATIPLVYRIMQNV